MRELHRLLAGYGIWCLGQGLVIPWIVVYLVQVRDMSSLHVGLCMGAMSFGGALAILVAIRWQDGIGHTHARIIALCAHGASILGYLIASSPFMAAVASVAVGAGAALAWNAFSVEMVMIPADFSNAQRFGWAFMLQNAGYGSGSLISALWIHAIGRVFWPLFVAGAVVSWVWAGFAIKRFGQAPPLHPSRQPEWGRGIVSLQLLLPCMVFGFFAIAASGFAILFPLWVTGPLANPPSMVGWANSFNAAVVVMSQLALSRWRDIKPRLRMIGGSAVGYGTALAIMGATVRGVWTRIGLFSGMGLVGVADSFLNFSLPGLINDYAPEDRRGQYNGMVNLSWQLGSIMGGPFAGVAISRGEWGAMAFVSVFWCVLMTTLIAGWARIREKFMKGDFDDRCDK